jgi:ubiquinone/menaquinone biosynthesis C-methylase UbiE
MSGDEPPDIVQTKAGVAEVFGRAAPLYDRVGPRFFSHFGHRLVDLARIPSGARVLDVATGTGAVLVPAAAAVGPHGRVTGIDLSEAMIQEATEEISRLGLANVEVLQMDAEDLQLPDASFSDGLDTFRAAVLARIRTLRRPDGIHQSFPALFTLGIKPRL